MKKNLLEMVPQRREYKWELEGDKIFIVMPRLRSSVGKKFIKVMGKNPTYKLKLDQFCSFFWQLCDGTKTVEEIGKRMKNQFGDAVEPLYPRLSKFLQMMERNKLIKYEE
jgi:hypothetical protein